MFDSKDSDFEMLQNPLCYSDSSSFPQLCPRVTDSPNLSFESTSDSKTLRTHIRAPNSPYKLRSLPLKDYKNPKPSMSFPT